MGADVSLAPPRLLTALWEQVGFRTWYPGADERHIQRCKLKDSATSQAALGFKICGMQVCSLQDVGLRAHPADGVKLGA